MRILNMIRNHTNWFAYLIYKYFSDHREAFTFKGRSGINITVPARLMQTYKECFFDETYFKGLPPIAFPEAPIVLDIGANVGYFSLFTFSRFPHARVFAFEPMPVNFRLLNQYRDENKGLDLTIINKAVSGEAGTITLQYDANDSYTTAASIFDQDSQKDKLTVDCVTLSSVMDENKLERIDFLKLDCEGSEYGILYKCPKGLLDKISVMSIETHPGKDANENITALSQFLSDNGYQIRTKRDIIWAWR